MNIKKCPNCKSREIITTMKGAICPVCGCEIILHDHIFTEGPAGRRPGRPGERIGHRRNKRLD